MLKYAARLKTFFDKSISSPLVGEDKGGGITPILTFPHKGGRKILTPLLIFILFFSFSPLSAQQNKDYVFGEVPDFTFTDHNEHTLSLADLKGKVWIANFIFTRCQGSCPFLTGTMANIQSKLPSEIKLVSFSVDPEHDTPAILHDYASRYKAEEDRWFFVTTNKKQEMYDFVIKGFMLGVEESSPEDLAAGAEPVMHSTRFALIDGEGMIRGYFDSQEKEKMDELVKEASLLVSSDGA